MARRLNGPIAVTCNTQAPDGNWRIDSLTISPTWTQYSTSGSSSFEVRDVTSTPQTINLAGTINADALAVLDGLQYFSIQNCPGTLHCAQAYR